MNCLFHVARQRLHDMLRHAIEMLDFFGEDRAHPRDLIGGKAFERFDCQIVDVFRLAQREAGHDARYFAREFGTNVFFLILCKTTVHLRRRGDIGCNRTARRRGAVVRQECEDVVARVGAAGEFVLCRRRALFEKAQHAFRSQIDCLGLVSCHTRHLSAQCRNRALLALNGHEYTAP